MNFKNVILGPSSDLHVGIHLPLVENPPPGFRYNVKSAKHHFLFRRGLRLTEPLSPFRYMHFGEYLDFGSGDELAHVSHYPVINRRCWIADTDDFHTILLLGKFVWHPRCHDVFKKAWSPAFTEGVRHRMKAMLKAYAHPSCGGILFFTQADADTAKESIRKLGLNAAGKDVVKKFQVIRPSQAAISDGILRKKWRHPSRTRVLFCGRDFYGKNGAMALEIFFRLAAKFKSARFDYVGFIPENEARRYLRPPKNVFIHPLISHEKALRLFRDAHVFFHPSKTESLGMVFLEAAAAGLAVVTAKGQGMDHIGEIFDKRGALFLDRDVVSPENESGRFGELLESLLSRPDEARALGLENYELAIRGRLSRKHQHARLKTMYETCLGRRGKDVLELGDVRDAAGVKNVPFSMRSEDIHLEWLNYKEEIGFKDLKNLLL